MSNSQPTTCQSEQSPLFIPDVAYTVLAFVSASPRDGYNLAMACKTLFQFVMPQLWRTVTGIEQLLLLIPGAVSTRQLMGTSKKITITISKLALDEPWDRFRVYSTYVRRLRVLALNGLLQAHEWDILFAKLKELEEPLLPNLECLDVKQPTAGYDPLNYLVLFGLLLSPSITKLDFRDYPTPGPGSNDPGLGPEFLSLSALSLVNGLAKAYGITLPPHYNLASQRMIELSDLGVDGLTRFERFPVLTNLTRLFIHLCAVAVGSGEGLIVLGHLPHLEALEIMGSLGSNTNPHRLFKGTLLPIPSALFPCLRTLHLLAMPSTQLLYHMWSSETIVSKLTEVAIHLDQTLCLITWKELVSQIVPLLSRTSSTLRVAALVAMVRPDGPSDTQKSQLELLSALLSSMSVPALTLRVLTAGPDWLNVKPFPLHNRVFTSLQHLEILMPLYRSGLKSLATSLPNLRHIIVLLRFEPFEGTDTTDNEPSEPVSFQPIMVHIRYVRYDRSANWGVNYLRLEENRSQITRFIKSMWPNLSYLSLGNEDCFHNYRKFGIIAV
ncbi:unnamed protein product [Rhizoctonia solani]|uniref:Uncharacterized protein n=1 Tax=Rhizoctonia solani TaxID=456999 RepID=A0A8H3E7X7_9AGAM|nr:unnamed protein product [Rhizoctonia solani]